MVSNDECVVLTRLPVLMSPRDTVGTERFDSITTQYYRGGAVSSYTVLFCVGMILL
jgi:hypothetical protein